MHRGDGRPGGDVSPVVVVDPPCHDQQMPLGYIFAVAILSWGVACALTRWSMLGLLAAIPALLGNELPFLVAYLLIADTVLAWTEGDLATPGGAAAAGVALLVLAGLVLVVRRAMRAHAAMGNTGSGPAAMDAHPSRALPARQARRGSRARPRIRRLAAPTLGRIPPPRPAVRDAGAAQHSRR
jgi:hypothetical protein